MSEASDHIKENQKGRGGVQDHTNKQKKTRIKNNEKERGREGTMHTCTGSPGYVGEARTKGTKKKKRVYPATSESSEMEGTTGKNKKKWALTKKTAYSVAKKEGR